MRARSASAKFLPGPTRAGYASEAARACLGHALETLGRGEVVSFSAAGNPRSRAVMERIGMQRDRAGEFEHPRVPEDPPRRPALYPLSAEQWRRDALRAPSPRRRA